MKLLKTIALSVGLLGVTHCQATLNVPSNGSDGDLVVTNNLVIDLSLATPGKWDTNNSANAGHGVYDFTKWAVVFHYRSVIIQGGGTVTFINHPSRAPVVWLVQGDVTINGVLSLNGQNGLAAPWLAEPGPGGFRGGSAFYAPGAETSPGFGPGGGYNNDNYYGRGGSYGTVESSGVAYSYVYGNKSLIPLIGGSGAATFSDSYIGRSGGGAGAGAILIAAAGQLSIVGSNALVRANGGAGVTGGASGGSGGGIRLVAETFAGDGTIQALGGSGGYIGGLGRIRIERMTNSFSGILAPSDPSLVQLDPGATPVIWMPTNGPSLRIVSIGGITPPADPRAEFGSVGADTVLPPVTNATVVVETTNVEPASVVLLRASPRANGRYTESTATVTQVVSEDPLVIRWTGNVPVQSGYAAIQVRVIRP